MIILNANELYTLNWLKWWILCYVDFTLVFFFKQENKNKTILTPKAITHLQLLNY